MLLPPVRRTASRLGRHRRALLACCRRRRRCAPDLARRDPASAPGETVPGGSRHRMADRRRAARQLPREVLVRLLTCGVSPNQLLVEAVGVVVTVFVAPTAPP